MPRISLGSGKDGSGGADAGVLDGPNRCDDVVRVIVVDGCKQSLGNKYSRRTPLLLSAHNCNVFLGRFLK